jgi:uncharacterized small protein (TIGR04563 family)
MDKVEQALFFPAPMLEEIATHASRLDTSLSWLTQKAWSIAKERLRSLEPLDEDAAAERVFGERYSSDDKRKQTILFPSSMLDEVKAEAARQDRSLSWIIQRAWCVAIADIETEIRSPDS